MALHGLRPGGSMTITETEAQQLRQTALRMADDLYRPLIGLQSSGVVAAQVIAMAKEFEAYLRGQK